MKHIYLDHAAATPISAKALRVTMDIMNKFSGNPSAIHKPGREARSVLEAARKQIAVEISARPQEIVFTSGATESNNLAIVGVVDAARARGVVLPHVIVSAVEHPAVLEVVRNLEKEKLILLDILGVDDTGRIDTRELRKNITSETVLVSIMYVNNEIGTIEPVAEIAKEIRHARKVHKSIFPYFHTDAAQASNYLDLNVLRLGVDLMTISSSKTYGPRGVGALYVKQGIVIEPLMHGGMHESGRRPGTESTALAAGFAEALHESRAIVQKESKRIQKLRDTLANKIIKKIPGATINGNLDFLSPNILNVSIPGIDSEALVLYLDARGIAASGQSACKSSEDGPSHVIMAIGKISEKMEGTIRFSLGRSTTSEDIARVVTELPQIVAFLQVAQKQSDVV